VALTFDDLPVHAALPPGVTRVDVARETLAALTAAKVKEAYGFVNAKGVDDDPATAEVLRLWRAAGYPLANHAWSHMDLHANTAEAFQQDVARNEATLRAHMGESGWRFLRYPYLREGDTLEKRRSVRAFLAARGYRVAQVTMNFDDWAYGDPYARCAAAKDAAGVAWLEQRYLARAAASMARSRDLSQRLYGRDIPYVLLLHIGSFGAVMMPKLLALLDERGFDVVTLEEAQADAAYAYDPDLPFATGTTFFDQVIAARRLDVPSRPDDTLGRLQGLCRPAEPAGTAGGEGR
jgi:peptidoglycan/xylan/chitin deacetylase (PgdA/CDA1 family)